MTVETGRLAPDAVRTMFDRICAGLRRDEPDDDARARPAAGGARPPRRSSGTATACSTRAAAPATSRSRPCEAGAAAVTGLDFSRADARARSSQVREIEWVQGDLLALPFDDGEFDAATVGFGVRNLDDLERRAAPSCGACSGPAGRLAILEITQPRGVLAPFYRLWFDRLVPLLGRGASRRLGVHVPSRERAPLPGPEDLAALLREAGFEDVRWHVCRGRDRRRCTSGR